MFCSKGRCNVNSCPAHYDEDYWDVEEPEQIPRSGRSQLRAGQEYGSNLAATVSNIQNTQQFLNSLKNLQILTQNLIVAFDQVPNDGRNLRRNSQQATNDWLAGIPNNYQSSPYPSGGYPPAYQPSSYPTSAYQANNFSQNAYTPSGQLPMPNFEDTAFHKRFGLPPPIRSLETQDFSPGYNEIQTHRSGATNRSNQGYDNDNSDYRTINVPVLLEVSFDGKEAEITKVMHITDTGYSALSQGTPEPPPELICGDDQQPNYSQPEYPALNERPPDPFEELSCPIERQRDNSRPLPKPQQKDLKRCVSCPCDECPVYFTDSDLPECPNDCGCCNCDIKIIKIREAQKKIKICKCTGVAGPCKCKPTLDECTCMKLAEKYLDALDGKETQAPRCSRLLFYIMIIVGLLVTAFLVYYYIISRQTNESCDESQINTKV